MSAEWKRAPLPEGHEEEGLTHDGSNGMGRILLAGLAVGAVFAVGYWYRAEKRMERARQRAHIRDHAPTTTYPTVTGTVHLDGPGVDVAVGDTGWQHRGEQPGGQLFLMAGAMRIAQLGVERTTRANGDAAPGLQADLATVWPAAGDDICASTDARGSTPAIYCNDDPTHVWAWADGDTLLHVHYTYDHVERQPDFAEIQRIVASVR